MARVLKRNNTKKIEILIRKLINLEKILKVVLDLLKLIWIVDLLSLLNGLFKKVDIDGENNLEK